MPSNLQVSVTTAQAIYDAYRGTHWPLRSLGTLIRLNTYAIYAIYPEEDDLTTPKPGARLAYNVDASGLKYRDFAKKEVVENKKEDEKPERVDMMLSSRAIINAQANLHHLITATTNIPIPRWLKADHTDEIIPDGSYVLLSHLPGQPLSSLLPVEGSPDKLDERGRAKIDLRVGLYLKQLHQIQNDWFGFPGAVSEWGECYSWQVAFLRMLEIVMAEARAEGTKLDLPFTEEEVNTCLSRAISFFLFDDVDVPSLVWCPFLGWEANVRISRPSLSEDNVDVTGLEHWGDAMWGDPLMEDTFRSPSEALHEGYGGSLIIFPRQNTKRLWYTFYAALRGLLRLPEADYGEDGRGIWTESRMKVLLKETWDRLKTAPCY